MSVPLLSHYKNLLRGFERAAVPLAPPFFRLSLVTTVAGKGLLHFFSNGGA